MPSLSDYLRAMRVQVGVCKLIYMRLDIEPANTQDRRKELFVTLAKHRFVLEHLALLEDDKKTQEYAAELRELTDVLVLLLDAGKSALRAVGVRSVAPLDLPDVFYKIRSDSDVAVVDVCTRPWLSQEYM